MDSLKRLIALRFRISTQLFAAFGVAVALTVAASLIGWFSFQRVDEAQAKVNEGSVPEIEAAFGVAEHSSALVAAAPRLSTAANEAEVAEVWAEILAATDRNQGRLEDLEEANPVGAQRISGYSDGLQNYIETIRANMGRAFDLNHQSDALLEDMVQLRAELEQTLTPAADDQLFYIFTGRNDLEGFIAPYPVHFSEDEFGTYRHLSALQADTNIALQQLSSVFSIFDPDLVEAQQERFESSMGSIKRNLDSLNNPELEDRLVPLYTRLERLGLDSDGVFVVLRSRLQLNEEQAVLVGLSRDQSASLAAEVDSLVTAAVASAEEATEASDQAISTGSSLLIAISVISVGSALLISWLFVGRVLLHRINILSARMRRMAAGELEEEVEVTGHDELAEMAGALEVFRHNSLEALRLNLVEELNTELEGKNTELESVLSELDGKNTELEGKNTELESVLSELDGKNTELEGKNTELEVVLTDLQTAQDQIVMREKLAALGEVTAGVAHEIRNPLNFVKNFSEASEELLTEMREALEEGDSPDVSLIADISKDLVENLERIRHHGDRANRIVNDMLLMGRGSSNWQPIDLNTLLVEHAMLAYHSARATDTEFQLTVEHELDEDVGYVEAIPQDLGRTFLNIVGNAGQATDERRRKFAAEGIGFEGYTPTVWLYTRGLEHEVEIRIRDNGPGIPHDIVEKIFNPFFTTKPTNQGTGLGLAITSDIVRQHGGTIRVESEPGDFTEMIITIPRTPPPEVVQAASDGSAAEALRYQ